MRFWWLMMGLASAASAEPVYLRCDMQPEAGSASPGLAVEISADEANQQAIVALPSTGRVVTRRAIFTPNDVRILDEEGVWTVNRVNLALSRTVSISDKSWVHSGKCSIAAPPPKRAF